MKDLDVKVVLPEGTDELDADNFLYKALSSRVNGEDTKEAFDDPAMVNVSERLEAMHSGQYDEMLKEIFQVLDEEYT